SPQSYCLENAILKAQEVAERYPGRFILGADTVVILGGVALGKPRDREHGAEMLRALSDRPHIVATAFALISPDGSVHSEVVETTVFIKALREWEIQGYLETGEPDDKAGAYAIQGIGTFLVAGIEGSYSNVVGLPVMEVLGALEAAGGPRPFQH
ncbi:MAG: septum formation protein Maf, partial [Halioglobus sp.]|nr:septum formation protein Maf [Halioglobus sp.]